MLLFFLSKNWTWITNHAIHEETSLKCWHHKNRNYCVTQKKSYRSVGFWIHAWINLYNEVKANNVLWLFNPLYNKVLVPQLVNQASFRFFCWRMLKLIFLVKFCKKNRVKMTSELEEQIDNLKLSRVYVFFQLNLQWQYICYRLYFMNNKTCPCNKSLD